MRKVRILGIEIRERCNKSGRTLKSSWNNTPGVYHMLHHRNDISVYKKKKERIFQNQVI